MLRISNIYIINVLALTILFVSYNSAFADLTFKKNIIENCTEAKTWLTAQPAQLQHELIQDIKLVLKLKLENAVINSDSGSSVNIGLSDQPMGDPKHADLWKALQPLRELRAKRCAVELLTLLHPFSLEALPELLDIAGDKTIPFDLHVAVDAAISDIAIEIAKNQSLNLPNSIVLEIIERLDSSAAYFTKNLLLEIGDRIIGTLIGQMQKPDPRYRELISDSLLNIDDGGTKIASGILLLLNSPDDGLRKRAASLLSELEESYSFSVPALIKKLDDLSEEVEDGAINSLKKISSKSSELGKIAISDSELDILISKFTVLKDDKRARLIPILQTFGPLAPSYQEKILDAFKTSNDEHIKGDFVLLLSYSINPSSLSIKTIYDATFSESLPIRLKAIDAASRLPNKNETIRIFVKLLKSSSLEKDTERKEWTVWQVANSVAKINPADLGSSLVPFFTQFISLNKHHPPSQLISDLFGETTKEGISSKLSPVVEALVAIGKSVIPYMIKALSSKDALVRIRAAQILSRINPSTQNARSGIIKLLEDANGDVRLAAEQCLTAIGSDIGTDLKRLLNSKNEQVKLAALRILLRLKWPTQDYLTTFKNTITSLNCADKVELLRIREDLDRTLFTEETELALINCALQSDAYSQIIIRQLSKLAPLSAPALASIKQALLNPNLSKKILLNFIESAPAIQISNQELLPILLRELGLEDKTVQHRVFILLRQLKSDGLPAVQNLIEFIKREPEDKLLLHEAITTLILLDPTAYDYVTFYVNEFHGENYPWIKKSLVKIPTELAIPVLARAVKELPDSKKYRVVEVMGVMGETLKELTAEILPLLSTQDPELHYYVTAALLKIDPTHPETKNALKIEIRRDVERKLLREEFNISLKPFLETFKLSSESKVEHKFIDKLIRSLKAN